MKDNFSIQAGIYAQFRPTYPNTLLDSFIELAPSRGQAWDCATGNGQVATYLSAHFDSVWASDISENQLKNAPIKPNITYAVESAEQTALADNSIDLLVVAQALHWFHFEQFYAEARRVLRPNGIIAVIAYPLMTLHHKEINDLVQHFYHQTTRPYWDAERTHIDENYQTIPFPWEEIAMPPAQMTYTWTAEQLIGYLNSWSATQHYVKKNGQNPVDIIKEDIIRLFELVGTVNLHFDIIQRVGRNSK